MPRGLYRLHESGQSHFVTFSCYRRQPFFNSPRVYDLFPMCLERMRRRFQLRVYGYVVMPEHVHLLLSEPNHGTRNDYSPGLAPNRRARTRGTQRPVRSGKRVITIATSEMRVSSQ